MYVCMLGTFIVQLIAFFVGNSIFFFLDLTGRPKFLQKYKIQERKNFSKQVFLNYEQA